MLYIFRLIGFALQARGKFGLRTRTVVVHEATFIEEAERQLLGGALLEWQKKAETTVAAAALDVSIAERRLLHTASKCALFAFAAPPDKLSELSFAC